MANKAPTQRRCRLQLLDEGEAIFERYRALFGLRNQGTPEAVAALGESFSGSSALLKHEVAYVLGQMLQSLAIPFLRCHPFVCVRPSVCLRPDCSPSTGLAMASLPA